jgi:hypothetical protein
MLLLSGMAASACDVCGASGGNQNLGLLPQFYSNFAGLQYQYRSFTSTHPSHEVGSLPQQSEDNYNTVQAWGRYAPGNRIQLFAFVPYYSNAQTIGGVKTTTGGLGDITVMGSYAAIKKTAKNGTRHQLLTGLGVKAPTGSYEGISSRDEDGLPNMQPGTGSWDFVANANYTWSRSQLGFNTEISYTFTTANKDEYKYGDRLSTGITGFYSRKLRSLTLLPMAGVKYEYTLHDYENYSRKWLNEDTGGSMLYGTLGMQAYYNRLALQLNLDLPLAQSYAGGNVQARYRTTAGVLFLF